MLGRVRVLAAVAALITPILVASGPPVALARPRPAAAVCEVSRASSPLTPTEAALVFDGYGRPPVVAPNGDMYFAPTLTSGAIEELDREGRLVWQYALPHYALEGWAATRTDLVALSAQSETTSLLTVNLQTHAVTTTTVPNLDTYQLVATANTMVLVGSTLAPMDSTAVGTVMVLGPSGKLLRRWAMPTSWLPHEVMAIPYGGRVYLVAQANALAAPSGHWDTDYVVDEIAGSSIRHYSVALPFARAGVQVVAVDQILFYGVNPATMNPIISVRLGARARVAWRVRGPVGQGLGYDVVAYGRAAYVAGDAEPMLDVPAWRLALATGQRLGEMRLPGYAVYPALAGPWGLIALVQRGGSGSPAVAVFSLGGMLRFKTRPNATMVSSLATPGFVMQSGAPSNGGNVFLSGALPAGVALALPAKCVSR